MVDDFYSNSTCFRLVERAGDVAVECCPGIFVDFGLESGFERFVGVVGAKEVGVTDKE